MREIDFSLAEREEDEGWSVPAAMGEAVPQLRSKTSCLPTSPQQALLNIVLSEKTEPIIWRYRVPPYLHPPIHFPKHLAART